MDYQIWCELKHADQIPASGFYAFFDEFGFLRIHVSVVFGLYQEPEDALR